MVRIVKICQNLSKLLRWSKIVKIVENGQNCQKLSTLLKIIKIIKIVKTLKNCQKMSKHSKNFQTIENCQKLSKLSKKVVKMSVRSCFLITLIKCLKGHKSLGSLCNVKIKRSLTHSLSDSVSDKVTY